MLDESSVKTISLSIIAAIVFIIGYLFYKERSEFFVLIIFFGFFFSIIFASGYLLNTDKKITKKKLLEGDSL